MDRRKFLQAAGLTAAGLSVNGCGIETFDAGSKSLSAKPNIILVMADDQGWGDVGYYGHPVLKTPNLDDMAASSLRFDRFYAAAPVCSPTRVSVMTGRHPNRSACFSWGHSIRPQEVTVAEALKTAGYKTGHFGKWHIGSVFKDSPVNPAACGFDEWFSAPNFFDNDPILSSKGQAVQMTGESSTVTAEAAIEFIRDNAKKTDPFLAVVWFGSPHNPHRANNKFGQLYADQKKKKNFYGEISGIDFAVGKLRGELKKLDIEENTLLWYCSDNGGLPGYGITGGRGHKKYIYEGGLRVPAIMQWPARIAKPKITNMPCNTSDIFPTLLDVAGVKPDKRRPLDGISLTPLIAGQISARPKPMGFWSYPEKGISTPSHKWMGQLLKAQQHGEEITDPDRLYLDAGKIKKQYPKDSFPGHAAWLDWPWKLHRIENTDDVKWELYDLSNDGEEQNDLFAKNAGKAESLKARLERWQRSVVDSLNGKDY